MDDTGETGEATGTIIISERPVIPTDGPDGDGGGEESPGPGAILAMVSMATMATALAVLRRRQRA
jgi:hypothetical protein